MIRKVLKDIFNATADPSREFSERVFLSFTIISEIAIIIALAGDLVMKENIIEILVLIATLILMPAITLVCFYKNKLRIAIRIISAGIVFIILPSLFFFGGALKGGGIFWIIFAFIYVGFVLSGIWRRVMIFMLIAQTAVCYLIAYYHPRYIHHHSQEIYFVDSFISVILVGIVCFSLTWVQNRFFMEENARAKKEAERAEELSRSQNRFFSSMSHEIRTPINSILGLNELILRDRSVSDEVIKDATGIQGAGKMLLTLINDILDFSKMEAESMDIVPVDYKVGDLLSEVVNMVWLRAQEKGLKFSVNVDPKVPSILYGDEVRIKQILINLLNNAVKYTAEGSVELYIESENTDDSEAVILRISVSDTGMGIKKETLPYLFDAFKRVDEEKNRYIEGTGLGLSIVKQLVDLMGGTITVNSVYGEGTTFVVVLTQHISDHAVIGEMNIHSQQTAVRHAYESSFRAPDARILIVDDNEMNLEVESRLLSDTEMVIDKALNGKEALENALKNRYDAILMDHLMPEMDGIECLENLRNQDGGLNRATPVIILTANAGSDNRELYNRAGFDGYLVKPVSGEAMENMLIRHIAKDKLRISSGMMRMQEDINTLAGYSGKAAVIITSTSLCDLPDRIIKKLNLLILPFFIRTEEGLFKDGVQMGADEIIRYMRTGKDAASVPPDEATYTEFFALALKKAHHLIHISITTSMSRDYAIASEAAKAFENVSVVNSGCISSSVGILVLIAHRLAQQNIPVQEIIDELEAVKHRMKCSFIIDKTEYMARKGLISQRIHNIATSLSLHPCLKVSEDRSGIVGIWAGSTRRAYKKYIAKAFPVDIIPDPEVVFITYVNVPVDTLLWIREEISKIAYFERVVFKQASAAISSNCGSGSFGILYFVKGNKSYNFAAYIEDEDEVPEDEQEEDGQPEQEDEKGEALEDGSFKDREIRISEEPRWYQKLDHIDGDTAIVNSGSEDALKTVIKIFHDSIPEKSSELDKYYLDEDWESYTIKIHALKSSSRLIGALELGEMAESLEAAGKEKNSLYIKENHGKFMREYGKFTGILSPLFEIEGEDKPAADEFLLESVYEGLKEAAGNNDCSAIEEIYKEMDGYSIPEEERERYESIRRKADSFDYEGMLELL